MALPLIIAGLGALNTIIGGKKQKKALRREAEAEAVSAEEEARATESEGVAMQVGAEFQALQLDINAKQQQAAARRSANEELRKSELLQSRALAVAGASGGSASDPDILRITSRLAQEGQYAADTHTYNGDEAARAMRIGAAVSRYEGKQARKVSVTRAGSLRRGGVVRSASLRKDAKSVNINTLMGLANTGLNAYSDYKYDKKRGI